MNRTAELLSGCRCVALLYVLFAIQQGDTLLISSTIYKS
jgi:hypothetical protein